MIRTHVCAILALVGLMAGCSQSEKSDPTSRLSGGAVKGVLKNAIIRAYKVENDVIADQAFAEAESDDLGQFVLSFKSGVPAMIFLEAVGNSDGSTKAQCDYSSCGTATPEDDSNSNGITDFGEWSPVSATFRLTAYVSEWSSDYSASINPITHMIASQFESPPSEEDLADAYSNAQESLALSVSPDEMSVIDLMDTDAGTSSQMMDILMAAALVDLVGKAASDATLEERLSAMDASMSSEGVSLDNVSLTELTQYALGLAENLPVEGKDSVVASLQTLNQQAADSENRLPLADVPMLPPFQ